jgi:hypothetical protein
MSTIREELTKLLSNIYPGETASRLASLLDVKLTVQSPIASQVEALFTSQAEEIKRLKQENERLQQAHDHQYRMAGQMLREAERNGAERDTLKTQLEQSFRDRQIDAEHHARRERLLTDRLRAAGFTLDADTWVPPPSGEGVKSNTMKAATGDPLDPVAVRLIGDIVTVIRENDDINSSAIAIVAGLRTGRLKLPENSPQIQYWRDNARYWKREHEEVAGTLQAKSKECREAQDDLAAIRAEAKRLKDLIDKTAAVFMDADRNLGIPFEGAIDGAMKSVCDEVQRLRQEMRGFGIIIARDQKALRNAGFEFVEGSDGPAWKPPLAGEEERSLRSSLHRFQEIARQTDKALRSMVAGIHPDIDAIQDGCIKIHLKEVLEKLNVALGPDKDQEAFVSAIAKERDDYKKRKDDAYTERNRVVAAFAKLATIMDWPVAVTRTAIEGWSEDWHGCVFIDTPQGQVSWHFHDSQADLFRALPHGPATWDGHTTPQKYERLEALVKYDRKINVSILQSFKDLVHNRLDGMGIPKFENEDCRITKRMDEVGRLVAAGTEWTKARQDLLDGLKALKDHVQSEVVSRINGIINKP